MVTHYATEKSFFQSFAWIYAIQIMNLNISGDEFPRRLCDPLPPVILFIVIYSGTSI